MLQYRNIYIYISFRQITGSNRTAIETANLLRTVISNSRWSNAASLIQLIREIAVRIIKAQPIEFAVGNIIRRVLHLIREEYRTNNCNSSNTAATISLNSDNNRISIN